MTAPFTVSQTIGDIRVSMQDSCNCCFRRRKGLDPATPMYITKNGSIEPFETRISQEKEEVLRRCNSNLKILIEKMTDQKAKDKQRIFSEIQSRVVVLSEDSPQIITAEMIVRIREIIERS